MRHVESDLLKELYQIYGQELYRYLYTLCRDRMMAEDILQETFCKALLALPASHPNIRAWLYQVGRNLMLNEMKRKKRELPESGTDLLNREACRTDGGEDAVLRREEREQVKRALQELEGRKREVLLLQYFENLTLREAAERMGISHENARVLSCRAKKELRRIMERGEQI
ncbi:hypothetical protein B5F07_07395 [Lachnoclostridium sp. An169]|nr:hypothetical protein B5F07_07395 [Lachnoclostridium sp. An169]